VKQAVLLVCSGIHPPSDTDGIVATIAADPVLTTLTTVVHSPHPATSGRPHGPEVLSGFALRTTLETILPPDQTAPASGLLIWAYSAGCVGAVALATYWQRYRGPVLALFMVDGWGVPRVPTVITHRLSHDRFTHTTSRWLGAGETDFYADPAVSHRQLWRQPQSTLGCAIASHQPRQHLSAAAFLCQRSGVYVERYRADQA
jgi:hypothetical protein